MASATPTTQESNPITLAELAKKLEETMWAVQSLSAKVDNLVAQQGETGKCIDCLNARLDNYGDYCEQVSREVQKVSKRMDGIATAASTASVEKKTSQSPSFAYNKCGYY
jgi:prefoldin subunit 5